MTEEKKKMSKQTDTSKDERYEQPHRREARVSLSLRAFSLYLSSQRADLGSREVSLTNATSPSSYDDIKKYVRLNKTSTRFARSKKTGSREFVRSSSRI